MFAHYTFGLVDCIVTKTHYNNGEKMDSYYHFSPKFIRDKDDLQKYQDKIAEIDLLPGITTKIFTFKSFAYARICFDGKITDFHIDGDGDFFYMVEGISIYATKRIVESSYEDRTKRLE